MSAENIGNGGGAACQQHLALGVHAVICVEHRGNDGKGDGHAKHSLLVDANFAAYLACAVHPSVEYEYSGSFMAYIYCYNALSQISTSASAQAASEISKGVSDLLQWDLAYYNTFFINNRDQAATDFANT
ncbi:MAG: DUF3810 family protein, partial [Clostridia bacterium]|nr:DUF3810 family protein [Clostridia bacterium]